MTTHGAIPSCSMYMLSTQPSSEMHWKIVMKAHRMLSKPFTPLGLPVPHTQYCPASQLAPEHDVCSGSQHKPVSSIGSAALALSAKDVGSKPAPLQLRSSCSLAQWATTPLPASCSDSGCPAAAPTGASHALAAPACSRWCCDQLLLSTEKETLTMLTAARAPLPSQWRSSPCSRVADPRLTSSSLTQPSPTHSGVARGSDDCSPSWQRWYIMPLKSCTPTMPKTRKMKKHSIATLAIGGMASSSERTRTCRDQGGHGLGARCGRLRGAGLRVSFGPEGQ